MPCILGSAWLKCTDLERKTEKLIYSFVMGFFSMLALWELIILPGAMLMQGFRLLSGIYTAVVMVICGAILWRTIRKEGWNPTGARISGSILGKFTTTFNAGKQRDRKNIGGKQKAEKQKTQRTKDNKLNFEILKRKLTPFPYGRLYLVLFLVLLGVQLYYAAFYSRTYMADDAYALYSAEALADDMIYGASDATGMGSMGMVVYSADWFRRVLQTQNFYTGYLCLWSGLRASEVAHTVMYLYVLLLSYGAMYLLGVSFFGETEDREERLWIYLSLIALLYIFGYHSHYSLTFRLLGPNDEGKAILAVAVTPMVLYFFSRVMRDGYKTSYGAALMMLSVAAMSLTLGGAYTFAALILSMVFLGLIRHRNWRLLLYMVWAGIFPAICAGIYIATKFL